MIPVSIVIPCYNHGRYLGEAIESALAQTWRSVETIVVNDGSTDDTEAVVSRYPTVRYVAQSNRGLAAARNAGASVATGEWFIFLDADDKLSPTAVEDAMQCAQANPGCGLVYGGGVMFDDQGVYEKPATLAPPGPDPYEHLLRSNYIWMIHMSAYSREAIERAGGFDSKVDAAADYGMNLKIARQYPIAMHTGLVAECRYLPGSMSRNLPLMLSSVLRVLDGERKHVTGNPRLERAWRIGMRNWKLNFARLMLRQVFGDIRAGRLSASLRRNVVSLAHYGPPAAAWTAAGAVKALIYRSRPLSFRR